MQRKVTLKSAKLVQNSTALRTGALVSTSTVTHMRVFTIIICMDYGHCKLLAAEECEHYVSLSVAVIPNNTDTPS